MTVKIYFDGGCNPNPGMMETCYVIKTPTGLYDVHANRGIGMGTNNIAEWTALLEAMRHCHKAGIIGPSIVGDSMLVVMQAQGLWKIKKVEFKPFKQEFDQLAATVLPKLGHIRRDDNKAGNFLEFGRVS